MVVISYKSLVICLIFIYISYLIVILISLPDFTRPTKYCSECVILHIGDNFYFDDAVLFIY